MKKISVATALDVSFGKFAHISDSFLCEQFGLSFEQLEKIRKTTLFRYVRNLARAYRKLMDTNSSAAHFCFSMCIKWDETEQKVLAAVLPGSKIRTPLTIHVATAGIYLKTSTMPRPVMWNTAPLRIERTTADCLWKFLQRACPFGPWGIIPQSSACVWLVFVLCCDEASSNKRMIAHFEVVALAKRVNVIVWFSQCFLHILHRAVMPALKRDNLIGD